MKCVLCTVTTNKDMFELSNKGTLFQMLNSLHCSFVFCSLLNIFSNKAKMTMFEHNMILEKYLCDINVVFNCIFKN